jgi:uncharacterized protein (DUF983 family)
MSWLAALLHQVCPRCRRGRIFRVPVFRAPLDMHDACPECGLRFQREPGYFTGAMYVSYFLLALPATALYVTWLVQGWPMKYLLGSAFVLSLPLVPLVVRISRVIWIYVDRTFDP